jgi:hypothetical protein
MSNGELLQNFNREYRRRGMEAAARRVSFPSYNAALAKLRAGLAVIEREVIPAVFDVGNCQ